MSNLDIAAIMMIIATPADSFETFDRTTDEDGLLHHYQYHWRWGYAGDPGGVDIIVMTMMSPVLEDDGSVTVNYSPMGCTVLVDGELLRDRYVGVGLYAFNYDMEKPRLVRGLNLALRPLSNPVDRAPCIGGF